MFQLIGADHPVFSSDAYLHDLILFNVLNRAIRPSAFLLASDGRDCIIARNRADLACWVWTSDAASVGTVHQALDVLQVHFGGRRVHVTAREPFIQAVLRRFEPLGYREQKRTGLIAYKLDTLLPPPPVGLVRKATADDLDILCGFFRAFYFDCFGQELQTDPRAELAAAVEAGTLHLLEVDGQPAGYVKVTPETNQPTCVVQNVYTHPDFRGRGCAKHAVAHCVRPYLEQGLNAALYADAANPRSNAAYAKIGFQPVGTVLELVMEQQS